MQFAQLVPARVPVADISSFSPSILVALSTGVVINVVHRAMMTIMVKSAEERMPSSSPTFNTTSSTRPPKQVTLLQNARQHGERRYAHGGTNEKREGQECCLLAAQRGMELPGKSNPAEERDNNAGNADDGNGGALFEKTPEVHFQPDHEHEQ